MLSERTHNSTLVKAVLLDFGHTLVNYEADEAALLESYQDIHDFLRLAGISHRPIPDDLMLRVFRRLTEVITQSYADGQIEELDCLAIYDDAFRHLGYQLAELDAWFPTQSRTRFARIAQERIDF